eukprot:13168139-Alexandrium_andersonii.AAC.1
MYFVLSTLCPSWELSIEGRNREVSSFFQNVCQRSFREASQATLAQTHGLAGLRARGRASAHTGTRASGCTHARTNAETHASVHARERARVKACPHARARGRTHARNHKRARACTDRCTDAHMGARLL